MTPRTHFSYQCNACGLCCHNQVITLSPYDVIRLARAAHLSTTDAIARFTLRRGSLLRFDSTGACSALDATRCSLHSGRPLACRLYPLGLERGPFAASRSHPLASERYLSSYSARESFTQLEPAAGSAGLYGDTSTVAAFLDSQGVAPFLNAVDRYRTLLPLMRMHIAVLADFDRLEPREFWRRAFHEAMREHGYDPNALIDALFDADAAIGPRRYVSEVDLVDAHLSALTELIHGADDPNVIAAAAMLLVVSLGYSPTEIASG
jgi:Fe-S-cluster containining protein